MRDPYSFEGELDEMDELDAFELDPEMEMEAPAPAPRRRKRGCGCGCGCAQRQARESSELELDETDELDEFDLELDEMEDAGEVPPPYQWPKERIFKPDLGGTIPSGRYPTSPDGELQTPENNFKYLKKLTDSLDARIKRIRGMQQQRPRDQEGIRREENARSKEITSLRILLNAMIRRVTKGEYKGMGYGPKAMAKLTCQVRTLGGVWCENRELKDLRCKLVYWLRNARGPYAQVNCAKLGVNLRPRWCTGHKCCCPGET